MNKNFIFVIMCLFLLGNAEVKDDNRNTAKWILTTILASASISCITLGIIEMKNTTTYAMQAETYNKLSEKYNSYEDLNRNNKLWNEAVESSQNSERKMKLFFTVSLPIGIAIWPTHYFLRNKKEE